MPDVQAPRVSELENVIALDLETTGLDEQNDQILEVHARLGSIMSGGKFSGPEGISIVLPLSSDLRLWHPAVVEMHTKNGLIVESHNLSREFAQDGNPIGAADAALCAYLDRHWPTPEGTKPHKWTLLGNSVHFDLRFVRRLFPTFAKRLSHRVIDVSAIRIFCESLGLEYTKDEPAHRAKADVEYSIKSFERYHWFVSLAPWNSSEPSSDTAVG